MKPIFLCGFMGSGKTTVGQLLAAEVGGVFVDTDRELEKRLGMSVADLLRTRGEAEFRRHEAQLIEEIGDTPAVIALGGGSLMDRRTCEVVSRKGVLIYLQTSKDELQRRVGLQDATRPLWEGASFDELFSRREAGYSAASVKVQTDDQTPAQIARAILHSLGEFQK